jgi:hypothetical protein
MTEPTDTDRHSLHIAVGAVLVNAANFPEKVQSRLLGQNMRPLIDAVVGSVLDAGFRIQEPT